MNKITIIGSGNVGSTIAYTLATEGVASEIVMIDINGEKAYGEAMDIRQGIPFSRTCSICAGDYEDAEGSDIVVITSGFARKPGQSRLDLTQVNVDVIKSIAPQIMAHAPDATYIIVSNPVDVLTYVFCKVTGLPENRVIGSGTILDTSRLRAKISDLYSINQKNVHAYVLGEHGDTSFVPWSIANISNVEVEEYGKYLQNQKHFPPFNREEVETYVRKSGAEVISRKGATFYAVSMSVVYLCRRLLSSVNTTVTVSTMLHGEYGIDDVCLSLLNIVGNNHVVNKLLIPMTEEEIAKLRYSADTLKEIIAQINF